MRTVTVAGVTGLVSSSSLRHCDMQNALRAMAVLTTSDFVWLDIHKSVVDNICVNTHDYTHGIFALPDFAQKIIEQMKVERKTGAGINQRVKYEKTTLDINTGLYRDVIH